MAYRFRANIYWDSDPTSMYHSPGHAQWAGQQVEQRLTMAFHLNEGARNEERSEFGSPDGYDPDTTYDKCTTNDNGLSTLLYQINTIHGLEVTLPGKRRFIMPFKRTTRGLLDWQVMLSDYLATFATDRGNILITSEPENNDANFLIE